MANFAASRVIDADGPGLIKRGLYMIVGGVLALILAFNSVVSVPSGHVAVLTLFGKVTGDVLSEGIHVINPLKSSHVLSIRTQSLKETARVPSSEGLEMALDTSLVFHLNPDKAASVFQHIGPDYIETIVEPTLRSEIREATAAHAANALYSTGRAEVQDQIRKALTASLTPRGIEIENVLLRDIQLPLTLRSAIEAKQQAEQESLAMGFRLQKERQEADRKRIEAQGIHDFQAIVAQGISPQLLQWKGIEATEALAKSSNSKVVVIGSGKNGLPIILGGNQE